jgi:hypothetical protein
MWEEEKCKICRSVAGGFAKLDAKDRVAAAGE